MMVELRNALNILAVRWSAERERAWSEETALGVLEDMRQSVRDSGTARLSQAGLLAERGHIDADYEILESASFEHLFTPHGSLPFGELAVNVLFKPGSAALRRDRRFVELFARLGLCAFWAESGEWPDCVAEVAPFYDLKGDAGAESGSAAWLISTLVLGGRRSIRQFISCHRNSPKSTVNASAWTYQGRDIPALALKGDITLPPVKRFEAALDSTSDWNKYAIHIERINGPIFFISAENDQIWPSVRMSNEMMLYLKSHDFKCTVRHDSYPTGHGFSQEVAPMIRQSVVERFLEML